MRRPGGYAVITSPVATRVNFDGVRFQEIGPGVFETDTFTCCHCNKMQHVPARSQGDDYFCRNCMAPICGPCADHPCIPFMKKVEAREEQDRKMRCIGVI